MAILAALFLSNPFPKLSIGIILSGMMVLGGCARAPSQQANQQANQQASTLDTTAKNTSQDKTDSAVLLNVSYDVSRDLYKQYNPQFTQSYANQFGKTLTIQQSHGGSSKQALSVVNGLQADVVTMNQDSDIELLVKKGLVASNWQQAFPNQAVPYTSTIVFLVRADNPKGIQDWPDLGKSGIGVVMANPKTSGTARYAFLGAYGFGLHQFNQDEKATQSLVKNILGNVVTFDNGARAATTTFVQRGMGDVLITTENEAQIAKRDFTANNLQIIYPSYSIRINNPVAVVKAVTDRKGTTAAANAYLSGLWEPKAQEIMAQNYLRPVDSQVLSKYQAQFPTLNMFEPTQVFVSWDNIMGKFFKDGALFDQLASQP